MSDIDDDDEFVNEPFHDYESVNLNWDNYTQFDEIEPDGNSTLFIRIGNTYTIDREYSKLQKKLNKINLKTEVFKNKHDYDCLYVYANDIKIALIFPHLNCLGIRFINSKQKEKLKDFFEEEYYDHADFFGEIDHIEEEFTIKKSNIRVLTRTGLIKNDEFWEPDSFWKFYVGNEQIGKALIRFHASEMCDCAPTIMMFEIFPEFRSNGYGKTIIRDIERYMCESGFYIMRLDNTNATPFWRELGYDIDIDEGEKELDCWEYEDD